MTRIAWRSTLAEVGLVLLGLLLAFSVDRGWDHHKERQREAEYLRSLNADFRVVVSYLDTVLDQQHAAIVAGQAILQSISVPDKRVRGEAILQSNVPLALDFTPVSIATPTYDDMKSSGNLDLLRDRATRRTLAEFDGLLHGELALADAAEFNEWISVVQPYLARHLTSDVFLSPQTREKLKIPHDPSSLKFDRVVRDPEFWNLITHRVLLESGRRGALTRLRENARQVVEATAR